MKTINTYYVKRDNAYIWLGQNIEPLDTDEVIEMRLLTMADEGKVLVNPQGIIIGQCIWNKTNLPYSEIDIPEEPEEEIEEEVIEENIIEKGEDSKWM